VTTHAAMHSARRKPTFHGLDRLARFSHNRRAEYKRLAPGERFASAWGIAPGVHRALTSTVSAFE